MTYIEWGGAIRARLAGLHFDPAREAEIVDELSQHLDQRYDELRARGCADGEARQLAVDELDDLETLARHLRGLRQAHVPQAIAPGAPGGSMLTDVGHDLRDAARMIRTQPGFAATAMLTLAIAIGSNTAIFSLVHAAVLRALPFPDPDRIVAVWAGAPGRTSIPPANADVADWRRHTSTFAHIAAFSPRRADLTDGDTEERVGAAAVTSGFFETLGVQPVLGRTLSPEEDTYGGPPVALIGYGLWQRRFGGDRTLVGRPITIGGDRRTIVGILPPDFDFPRGAEWAAVLPSAGRTEVWLPMALRARDDGSGWSNWESRVERGLMVIGRVKPDVDRRQAQAEMDAFAAHAAAAYPASHTGVTLTLVPLREQLAAHTSTSLLLLSLAVGLLLLIACVNVANLLLARGMGRQQETAIRMALGASRGRLIRQLLTECALLAGLATLFGLLVAKACIEGFLALNPATYSRLNEASLDPAVLAFAAATSLITSAIFGTVPALQASRLDPRRTLHDSRGDSIGPSRVRSWLVAVEVALAVVLLTTAGLVVRSLLHVLDVRPGFRSDSVLVFDVHIPLVQYRTESSQIAMFEQLIARVQALPSVRAAGAISFLPLAGGENRGSFIVEGAPPVTPGSEPRAQRRVVTSGYFAAMGIPFKAGRGFSDSDTLDRPRVTVVNETLARQFFPSGDAVGRRIRAGGAWRTIVGVAGDVKSASLERDVMPQVYMPFTQFAWGSMTVVAHTDSAPLSLVPAVRRAVKGLDPLVLLADVRTMDQVVSKAADARRFNVAVLVFFAGTALLLTTIGIAGVVAFLASRRRREIGIRLALGAARGDVVRLILWQGMRPVAAGCAAGLVATIATSRIIRSQLFGVSAGDPLTLGSIAAIVAGAALLACWLPARRATRVQPVAALRGD